MCASIIAQNIQLENSKFTFVNKLMEQKEDTLTVTRQSSALAEAEKSSNYVNVSKKIANELLSRASFKKCSLGGANRVKRANFYLIM